MTGTADLVNGRLLKPTKVDRWNPKAHKIWFAHVTGYDPASKWKWQQDFLPKTQIDGRWHADLGDLGPGDIVRWPSSSHNKKSRTTIRIVSIEDNELEYERLSDEEAIEALENDDEPHNPTPEPVDQLQVPTTEAAWSLFFEIVRGLEDAHASVTSGTSLEDALDQLRDEDRHAAADYIVRNQGAEVYVPESGTTWTIPDP